MTFQQLQYLLEVHRSGSISQAAKNLYLSPSSVSVSVSNLEAELGYPIFVRSSSGLIPTTQGEKVLQYATRIYDAYRLLNKIEPMPKADIRINSSDHGVINRAFVRLVQENQDKPELKFSMLGYPLEENIQKMHTNESDLGLVFYFSSRVRMLQTRLEKSGLQWKTLCTIPAGARVGPGHRLYNALSVTPKELEQETLVEGVQLRLSRSPFLKGLMTIDPERIIVCESNGGKRQLISQGLAYDICPILAGVRNNPHQVRYIPIEGIHYQLIAYHNPRYPQRPEIKRFLELLEEELGKE